MSDEEALAEAVKAAGKSKKEEDKEKARSIKHDRQQFAVLIVCRNGTVNHQMRQSLKNLGFLQISTAPTHVTAADRVQSRKFHHIIFDAKESDMPPVEFVQKIMEGDDETIMIAVSEEPRIDDVFSLLAAGARGFIVPPFNVETLEDVLVNATEGPPLSDAVLQAPDRNAALVAVVLNNLYRLSVAMRQAREFDSAKRDVERYGYALSESVEMARLFVEGSDDNLRDAIVDACIKRANTASTRLGRTRQRLKKKRVGEDADEEAAAPA